MKSRNTFAWTITIGLLAGQPAQAVVESLADSSGELVAWGNNDFGQTAVPGGQFTANTAVPEPSVLGGLLVTLCGFAVRRGAQSRSQRA